jgi:hypothetical protein
MQLRISDGPYAALGIEETSGSDVVRQAFLALTKQYHPARFGRMSPEVQRLSNEVFLGIKGAHDQLMKLLGGVRGGVSQSGAIPAIRSDATGRTPTGQNAPMRPSTPVISRTTTPVQPVVPRTSTPQQELTRPGTPPPARPTTPVAARPATPPAARPTTPTATRPTTPPAATGFNADTVRHSGAPTFDERSANREAMISLNEQDWTKARQTLQQLALHRPQSKNYSALLAYARGREAHKLGRVADAALEYQRALELDPDLAMAKQALAEVQRRR